MIVVRFKNLNVGRSRPPNKFQTHSIAAAGNDLTYVHYDDLPHGFIQMTRHSKRCLESTLEIARRLGEALKKTRAAAAKR
jgi:acetyl esterase/lipase